MLQLISKGSLEANNIPLTLATKLAKMQKYKSTTAMVYRHETLDLGLCATGYVMVAD